MPRSGSLCRTKAKETVKFKPWHANIAVISVKYAGRYKVGTVNVP